MGIGKVALAILLASTIALAEDVQTPQKPQADVKKEGVKKVEGAFRNVKMQRMFYAIFQVEGWKSEEDVKKTKEALEKVEGVLEVTCSKYELGKCEVRVDPKVAQEGNLYQAVKDVGFTPIPMPKKTKKNKPKPKAVDPLQNAPAEVPGKAGPVPVPSGEGK